MARPSIVFTVVVPSALLWAAACRGGDAAAGDVTVRDSAGIRIVENAADLDATPTFARIGPIELSIGVLEGAPELVFGQIGAVRPARRRRRGGREPGSDTPRIRARRDPSLLDGRPGRRAG